MLKHIKIHEKDKTAKHKVTQNSSKSIHQNQLFPLPRVVPTPLAKLLSVETISGKDIDLTAVKTQEKSLFQCTEM